MTKGLRKYTPGAAPHAWILATGLAFALLLWTWWVGAGMAWTRTMIGARVPHSPAAASAPDDRDRDHAFTELGLAGDAFGGLNALLTAIAGVFVAWAGTLQRLALQQAQAEADEERAACRRQQFESLFFQRTSERKASKTSRHRETVIRRLPRPPGRRSTRERENGYQE